MTDPNPSAPVDDDAADVGLMQRAGQGDQAAFEQLVARYQHVVVGTVARMLGSASEAEDIAQQVFLRLWKCAPRYKPTAKFRTFLFTITRNLVFNESRRRKRWKQHSLDEQAEDGHREMPGAPAGQPDAALMQSELREAVDKAVAALPEKQRSAVILRRYQNMPYEEIASALNLSVPAVKSLLFRARSTLRESLAAFLR